MEHPVTHRTLLPAYLLTATLFILAAATRTPLFARPGLQLSLAVLLLLIISLLIWTRGDQQRPHPEKVYQSIRERYRHEKAGRYYCIAFEYHNSGKYHSMIDLNFNRSYQEEFFTRLCTLFGSRHVFALERDQTIIVTRFTDPEAVPEVLLQEMEETTRSICTRFHDLLKMIPIENRHYIKISVGTASQGIRREFTTVYDLVQLAQFTKLAAKERKVPYLIADEPLRALKRDIDDFTRSMDERFKLDEFNPFFQPVIDLRTNRIIGCESFVRWQKDTYRIIEAKKFTEIANEKNTLKDIDVHVINKTFHFIWDLHRQQLIADDFIMMVNISANTLKELDVAELRSLADRYELDPGLIEFDIKDEPLSDPFMISCVRQLRRAGFKVAVDIFTSDTFALRSFLYNSFDTIKIDKSILTGTDRLPDGPACKQVHSAVEHAEKTIREEREFTFYKTIVQASRSMQIKRMLKGVEHRHHLDFARRLKIDYVQGYYFTPPLEQHAFVEYMLKYREGILV
ncbi:MAG: EAL domain-containing protein [Spirochaetia bacterium]|nr:EAL domain-containing protein [Spirochaetia bacterium]